MRVLDGGQFLVRIFIGEEEKWRHKPLWRALLERLRSEGFAGTTVFHGVAGFGAASVIHTAQIVDLSGDLPVVLEVIDDKEHVDRLIPILDEMVTGGALITVEEVRVLKYAPRGRHAAAPPAPPSAPAAPPAPPSAPAAPPAPPSAPATQPAPPSAPRKPPKA